MLILSKRIFKNVISKYFSSYSEVNVQIELLFDPGVIKEKH